MDFDFDLYVKAEEEMKNATNNTGGVLSSISRVVSLERPKTVDVSGVISVLSQFGPSISSDISSFSTMFSGWKEAILSFYQQQGSFQQQYEDLILQIQQDNVSQFLWDRINIPFVHGAIDNKIEGIEGKKQELVLQAKELEKILKWANIETPNIPGYLARTGATVAKFGVSVLEGLTKLAESIVDFGAILATASFVPLTSIVDGANWVSSKIFGTNYDSVTKAMWKNTKAFTSTDYTTGLYDKFYKDTKIGQTIDKYSFYSDAMRSVGVGVGYIGGIIGLSVLTCGAAGLTAATPVLSATSASAAAGATSSLTIGSLAFTSGTSAAAAAAAATAAGTGSMVLTTQGVVAGALAAMAGIGKNTSAAWADGASTGEGLAYGTVAGMYEGLQMAGGMAVNSLNLAKGATLLTQQIRNTATHVALDTVDGASSGFIDPLFKSIYTPNEKNMEQIMSYVNYDKDGNQISNKTWNDLTYGEKYDALFKSNGGWNTVGSGAVSAAIVSGVSEVKDIKGAIKGMSIAAATPAALPEASIPRLKAGLDENVAGTIDDAGNFKIREDFYKADGVTPRVEPKTLYATDMPKKPPIIDAKFESPEPKKSIFENISDRIKAAREPKVEVVTEVPKKATLVGASDSTESPKVIYADAGKGTEATTHDSSTIYVDKDGTVVRPETVVKPTDTIRSKDIVEDAKYEAVEPKKSTFSEAYEKARTTATENAAARAAKATEKATIKAEKVKTTFESIDSSIEKAKATKAIRETELAKFSPEAKMINKDTDPVIYAGSVEDAAKKTPIETLYNTIKSNVMDKATSKVTEAAIPKKTIFDVADNIKGKVEESPILSKLFGKSDSSTTIPSKTKVTTTPYYEELDETGKVIKTNPRTVGEDEVIYAGPATTPTEIKPNTIGTDGVIYAGSATAAAMSAVAPKIDIPEIKGMDIINDSVSGALKKSSVFTEKPGELKSTMGPSTKPEIEISRSVLEESPVSGYTKINIDGKELNIPKYLVESTGTGKIEALLKGELSPKEAYEVLKRLDGDYDRYVSPLSDVDYKSATRTNLIYEKVNAGDYDGANKLLIESLKETEANNSSLKSLFEKKSEIDLASGIKSSAGEAVVETPKFRKPKVSTEGDISSSGTRRVSEVAEEASSSSVLKKSANLTGKPGELKSTMSVKKPEVGTTGKETIGDVSTSGKKINIGDPSEDSLLKKTSGLKSTEDAVIRETEVRPDVSTNPNNILRFSNGELISELEVPGAGKLKAFNLEDDTLRKVVSEIEKAGQKFDVRNVTFGENASYSFPKIQEASAIKIIDSYFKDVENGTAKELIEKTDITVKPKPTVPGIKQKPTFIEPVIHVEKFNPADITKEQIGLVRSAIEAYNSGKVKNFDEFFNLIPEKLKHTVEILSREDTTSAYRFQNNFDGEIGDVRVYLNPNDIETHIEVVTRYIDACHEANLPLRIKPTGTSNELGNQIDKLVIYPSADATKQLKIIKDITDDIISKKPNAFGLPVVSGMISENKAFSFGSNFGMSDGVGTYKGTLNDYMQKVYVQAYSAEAIASNPEIKEYIFKSIVGTDMNNSLKGQFEHIDSGRATEILKEYISNNFDGRVVREKLAPRLTDLSIDGQLIDTILFKGIKNGEIPAPKIDIDNLRNRITEIHSVYQFGDKLHPSNPGLDKGFYEAFLKNADSNSKSLNIINDASIKGVDSTLDNVSKEIEIDSVMKKVYDQITPSSYRVGSAVESSVMPQSFVDNVARDLKSGSLLKNTDSALKSTEISTAGAIKNEASVETIAKDLDSSGVVRESTEKVEISPLSGEKHVLFEKNGHELSIKYPDNYRVIDPSKELTTKQIAELYNTDRWEYYKYLHERGIGETLMPKMPNITGVSKPVVDVGSKSDIDLVGGKKISASEAVVKETEGRLRVSSNLKSTMGETAGKKIDPSTAFHKQKLGGEAIEEASSSSVLKKSSNLTSESSTLKEVSSAPKIEQARSMIEGKTFERSGNSKKCHFVSVDGKDYALLSYKGDIQQRSKLLSKIEKTNQLKELGFNTPRIEEVKFDGDNIYELQEKAVGKTVAYRNPIMAGGIENYTDDFFESLKRIEKSDKSTMLSLLNDAKIYEESGYDLDLHSDNFTLSDSGNFTIIDLDFVTSRTSLEYFRVLDTLPNIFSCTFSHIKPDNIRYQEVVDSMKRIAPKWVEASKEYLQSNGVPNDEIKKLLSGIAFNYFHVGKEEANSIILKPIFEDMDKELPSINNVARVETPAPVTRVIEVPYGFKRPTNFVKKPDSSLWQSAEEAWGQDVPNKILNNASKDIEIDPVMKKVYDQIMPSSYRLGSAVESSSMPQSFVDNVARDIKSGELLKSKMGETAGKDASTAFYKPKLDVEETKATKIESARLRESFEEADPDRAARLKEETKATETESARLRESFEEADPDRALRAKEALESTEAESARLRKSFEEADPDRALRAKEALESTEAESTRLRKSFEKAEAKIERVTAEIPISSMAEDVSLKKMESADAPKEYRVMRQEPKINEITGIDTNSSEFIGYRKYVVTDRIMEDFDRLLSDSKNIKDAISKSEKYGFSEDSMAYQFLKKAYSQSDPRISRNLISKAEEILRTKYSNAEVGELIKDKTIAVKTTIEQINSTYKIKNESPDFISFKNSIVADPYVKQLDSLIEENGSLNRAIDGMRASGCTEEMISYYLLKEAHIQDSPKITEAFLSKAKEILGDKYSPLETARVLNDQGYTILKKLRGLEEIHTFPSGTKVYVVKGMDWNTQSISIEAALVDINKALESLNSSTTIKSITIYDVDSPGNSIAEINYGIPEFRSLGNCDGENINIFKNGLKEGTIIHEVAHAFDHKINGLFSGGRYYYSEGKEWTDAIRKDSLYNDGLYPSEYAKTFNYEDFAESIRTYFENPKIFSGLFPNRTNLILKKLNITN